MLSLIVACAVAQMPATQPAPAPAPAWIWTQVYGQPVEVWGALRDGRLYMGKDWNDPKSVAPSERAKRDAIVIDQPPLPPRPTPQSPAKPALNYGIKIEQLRGEGRTLRASDPETLRKVTAEARKREYCEVHGTDKCPDGGGCKPKPKAPPEPERKPGVFERLELGVEELLTYAVAAVVVFAAVVLILQTPRPER